MRALKLSLLASGALLLAGASVPAIAASPMSDAFVANVRPNVDFLDDASRLALDNSQNARIRAFAHDEAMEQTITGNQLVAWAETNTPRGEAVALGAPVGPLFGDPLAPVGDADAAPLVVAGTVTNGVVDGALTGRSVAVTGVPLVGGTPLASGQNDMDRLRSLHGRAFDALYRATQRDALLQLATLYTDYVAKGDDPALRELAQRELPRVNHRLEQLHRM